MLLTLSIQDLLTGQYREYNVRYWVKTNNYNRARRAAWSLVDERMREQDLQGCRITCTIGRNR